MNTDNAGSTLIAAERRRQIEVEGWTPEHDDGDGAHDDGEMVEAAVEYCRIAQAITSPESQIAAAPASGPSTVWPWDEEWWKPTWSDPVRNLVKAGALIAAEIDRLNRRASEDPAP